MTRDERGFTAIGTKLIALISLVCWLAVAPNLFKNVGKSEVTTVKQQIESPSKAIDQYRFDKRPFPDHRNKDWQH